MTGLIKRSFSLAGHRTSVALEDAFWSALAEIAQDRGQTVSALVAAIDVERVAGLPLASALRLEALAVFRAKVGLCPNPPGPSPGPL